MFSFRCKKHLQKSVPPSRLHRTLFCALIALTAFTASAETDTEEREPPVAQLEIAGGDEDPSLGSFSSDSLSFRHEFSLASKNEVEAAGVSLQLIFLDGPDQVTAEFANPLVDGSAGPVDLGSVDAGSLRRFTVDATLPVPGAYRFALVLDGPDRKIYTLSVERKAPTVKILDAENGALVLTTTTETFERKLAIRADSEVAARNVIVTIGPFVGPDKSGAEVSLDGGKTMERLGVIDGREIKRFGLQANLPESGEYNGHINLTYQGGGLQIPVKITKSIVAASITPSFSGVGMEATPFREPATINLGISLAETEGRRVSLKRPILADLVRQSGKTTNISATPTATRFWFDKTELQDRQTFALAPVEIVKVRMEVTGLGEPGLYSGKVIFPAEDRTSKEVAVSFNIRRSALMAGLVIFAGVFLSGVLRLWATQLRPRMTQVRKVLGSIRALDEFLARIQPARPEEREVVGAMRRHLELAYDELRTGTQTDADALIARSAEKLGVLVKWVGFSREIAGLSLGAAAHALQAKLDVMKRYLVALEPADDSKTAAQEAAAGLSDEIKAALTEMLNRFQQQIVEIGGGLDEATRHGRWAKQVEAAIAEAHAALVAGNTRTASDRIESARLQAARILAGDLAGKLQPKPDWLSQPLLNRIGDGLKDAQEAERASAAVSSYRTALGLYLEPLSRHLIGRARQLLTVLKGDPEQAGLPEVRQQISLLEAQLSALEGVSDQIRNGELAKASAVCSEAQKQISNAATTSAATPAAFAAAAEADAKAAAAGGADIPEITVTLPIGGVPENLSETRATIAQIEAYNSLGDWIFQIAIAAIAVALGVYVLWAGEPTWGSETDLLLALLWGLGLHSLTSGASSYAGLTDLATKIK